MRHLKLILCLLLASVAAVVAAQDETGAPESKNAQQARRIFGKAYDMIYGPEGASFDYRISILKIYSSEGSGWYKGNKSKSTTRKSIIWDNGDIKYILKKGKGIVEIHDPKVNKKDKLLQKFKFNLEDFTYHIKEAKDGNLLITLTAKPGTKTSMSKIEAHLDRSTFKPLDLAIKVSFFWAHIYFSNFKAGGIDDKLFVFPHEKYPDYKIVDER